MEPGDQQGLDLVVGGVRTFAAKLRAAHRLAQLTQIEGCSQAGRENVRRVVSHVDIVGCSRPRLKAVGKRPWARSRCLDRVPDLVGGYTPETREADDEAVRRARIFVDRLESALDVGDILQPIASGAIRKEDVRGDLFDLVGGGVPGRLGSNDITLLKNAGGGHLDLMTAQAIISRLEAG